jgi:hypothetical protein
MIAVGDRIESKQIRIRHLDRTRGAPWLGALVACLIALLTVAQPVPAAAASNITAFTFDTQPDGYGGSGISRTFTPSNATVTASIDGGNGVLMSATNDDHFFDAIIRPPTGQTLAPGIYPTTRFATDSTAGLDVSGDGSGCSESTGTLTILEVSLGVSDVNFFAATYADKTCDASTYLAFGELRYHSSFDFRAASTTPPSLDFGTQPVARSSGPITVTVSNDGSEGLTLGTAGLSGSGAAMFAAENDTCSSAMLAPASTCTIDVTFHPDSAGATTAQLDLPDDTVRGARNVPLMGTGTFLTTQVTLKTSAKAVDFGKSIKVTAHLRDHLDTTSKQLFIYGTPYGGGTKLIKSGAVNSHGNLSVTFTPTKKTTFVAKFKPDGTYLATTSTPKVVGVAVRVTGKLTRFDARSGKYKIYRYTSNCTNHGRGCPRYTAKVAPNHRGKRVSFILQLFADGSWHTVLSFRDRLNARSMRTEIFVYRNARIVGFPTRVRVTFEGDADHLGDTSEWDYFKVVR